MARIVLADDHYIVRCGIRAILDGCPDIEVCGEAENGEMAVDQVVKLRPDLVILDVSMPVMGGLRAAVKIRQLAPDTKILIFTMYDATLMQDIARRCADAYLPKTSTPKAILSTISTLLNHRANATSSKK